MDHEVIQTVLDYVDENIYEALTVKALADKAGYSVFHFNRLFAEIMGISAMAYVTWRKQQFALYDLAQGKKVIDTAMQYGFDTHAGFTKAFKRCFGFPPSFCYLRIQAVPPKRETVDTMKNRISGGQFMNPHIIELTPFSVVGFPSKHRMPDVKHTADVPAFWNTMKMDSADKLTTLYNTFTKSKHFEVCLCYDVDQSTGEFTYLLGRGIDIPADLENITPEMTRIDISGGLYAVFSTPPVSDYTQTIPNTWNEVLQHWLPCSEFEFDETRQDFEYYDKRDHGCYFGGKVQMDICIPIRQKGAK